MFLLRTRKWRGLKHLKKYLLYVPDGLFIHVIFYSRFYLYNLFLLCLYLSKL